MLRFDVPPVRAHVIRWEAFLTFLTCVLALAVAPWLLVLTTLQGAVRGFLGHHRCPSHRLWTRIAIRRGWAGAAENAGAKMFAAKLLFIASSVALVLWWSGSGLWVVPCAALIAFSFLEWAFSFCAACWVYGAWYRFFPPAQA